MFSFSGVPPGTYTLALRAVNASGASASSNAVTLTFPAPCSGPPLAPSSFLAYRDGSTIFVTWEPPTSGPAPIGYVLNVTGSLAVSIPTTARSLNGTVGPGIYTIGVVSTNPCGASGGTMVQTVVVP
jgi:predicted phage tail protein